MSITYKVTEVFSSIQGEGIWAGTPMVFIRLSGCNYRCTWCDTDFETRRCRDLAGLVSDVEGLRGPARTCLTGGEPTMQDIVPLISGLIASGKSCVHIESNGHDPGLLGEIKSKFGDSVWITVSPKDMIGGPATYSGICDELKVVDLGQDLSAYDAPLMFLQPLWSDNRVQHMHLCRASAETVLKNPRWRLSVQTHKVAGMP